ncbi:hypothetical protein FQN53_001461 [Emmonsiellopsis sp. PD_33]|nr:hypothetical protein FQN53_001461 [Emmonsiellopsis sp. PD_33]
MIFLADIDQERAGIMKGVLRTILHSDLASHVFAQIVDGIPIDSAYEIGTTRRVDLYSRTQPSQQSVLLARQFCHSHDIFDSLELNTVVAQQYQDSALFSASFNMHLLELVAIAIHDLAGNLYLINHPNGRDRVVEVCDDLWVSRGLISLSTMFYCVPSRFPRAFLDVVGYWAEVQIFGGVVVFDRGPEEGKRHCNAAFIHPRYADGDIFELSEIQCERFSQLGLHRDSKNDGRKLILPFTPEPDARKVRHDIAFLRCNIYRDRYEREVTPFRGGCGGTRLVKANDPEMMAIQELIRQQEELEQDGQ